MHMVVCVTHYAGGNKQTSELKNITSMSISTIFVILKILMIELQKSVFTNGFDKVISSSESIHEIHYETNVVCIVLAHSHVNVVTTV